MSAIAYNTHSRNIQLMQKMETNPGQDVPVLVQPVSAYIRPCSCTSTRCPPVFLLLLHLHDALMAIARQPLGEDCA